MARDKYGLPGIYNASPITLTDGRGSALAVDVNGRLQISSSGGGVSVVGTYNVTPPVLINGGTSGLQLDANANLLVNPGALNYTTDSISTTPLNPSNPTLTNVASSGTSVTILAANTSRRQGMLFNDSTQILYLSFGSSAASSSSYTVQIPSGGYYELPTPVYTGQLTGIWASANGNARVTEIT